MIPIKEEIDLHRLTVDEALPKLDDFLHAAFRAGLYRIRCGKLVPKAETTRLVQGLVCKKCDQELTQEIMKDMRGF